MRITNSTIARNYSKSLNRNQKILNDLNMQMTSRRRFSTMAEDPASGMRAMQIRRNLQQISSYRDNAKTAKSQFDMAETSLLQISGMNNVIKERYPGAISDTNMMERDIYATELEKLRDEILTMMNAKSSDRFLFGGTNTETQPFTVDANGDLLYNNVKVKDIDKSDPAYDYLFKDAAYVDIGIGLAMQNGGDSQLAVANSAFKNTLVGLDFLGYGEDNLYICITDLIDELRNPDFDHDRAGALLDKFISSADSVDTQLTKLGSDANYLDFTLDRLDSEELNLIERKDAIETIDPEETIIDFEMQLSIYNAALAMGQRLLQPTLFDFMG